MLAMSRVSVYPQNQQRCRQQSFWLLVGIAFTAEDKCRADLRFRQHHAQAN
jgi:hypothetical protein